MGGLLGWILGGWAVMAGKNTVSDVVTGRLTAPFLNAANRGCRPAAPRMGMGGWMVVLAVLLTVTGTWRPVLAAVFSVLAGK